MKTTLRSRRDNAYSVRIALEPRVQILGSSPHASTWDNGGNRLLIHRGEWHYQVIQGTEDVYGPVTLKTFICQVPAGEMPIGGIAEAEVLALVETLELAPDHPDALGFAGPRQVEIIAADPVSGAFAVWSHREDVSPYTTEVHTFSVAGGLTGHSETAQPDDGSPRWHVPHAVVFGSNAYALERGTEHWPEVGPASGRLVRRGLGGGAGAVVEIWSPGERYRFPHSIAFDASEEDPRLWVFWTELFDPGTSLAYSRSYFTEIDLTTFLASGSFEIHFEFLELPDFDTRTYELGTWQAAGGPNTGGLCVFDGYAGLGPTFLTSGVTPNGFSQDPLEPEPFATFRWGLSGHLADVGPDLPIPVYRKGSAGLLGAWYGSLPETLEAP